ncbi:MAG: hypothetical protein AAF694_28945 [Bacteroidota bacterium]
MSDDCTVWDIGAYGSEDSLTPIFRDPTATLKEYAFGIQTTRGIFSGSDHYGIRAVVNDTYRYIWNLTPQDTFLNVINNKGEKASRWYKSWLKAGEKDAYAAELWRRYKVCPKEELYEVKSAKWCQKNLAEDPSDKEILEGLRKELLKWMDSNGDKGAATELMALERMWKHRKGK